MTVDTKACIPGDYNNREEKEEGISDVYLGLQKEIGIVTLHCLEPNFVLEVDKGDLLEALRIIGLLPEPTPDAEESQSDD